MSEVHSISVLVATFNRADYLRECLDSILAQTQPPDQLIVIDDGSEDSTEATVRSYGERVLYLRQANSGKSVALNRGMAHVTSSHVCFFDDDDFMHPGALALHRQALSAAPERAYSYSSHLVFNDNGQGRISDTDKWHPVTRPQSAKDGEIFIKTLAWGEEFLTFLQGMLIPVKTFEAIGSFNQKLFRGQDYDMMLRLAHAFPAIDVKSPTFVMRDHAGARGPARDRHSVDQRFEVWHRYDRQIILAYREALDLGDYLPARKTDAAGFELSDEERQNALIARYRIMLSHGLFAEGLQDLRLICEETALPPAKQALVTSALLNAMNFQHRYLVQKSIPAAREIRRLTHHTPTRMPIRKCARKGMYWSFRDRIRHREMVDAARLVSAMLWLV